MPSLYYGFESTDFQETQVLAVWIRAMPCKEFYPNLTKKCAENTENFILRPKIQYGYRCIDFHEYRNCSVPLPRQNFTKICPMCKLQVYIHLCPKYSKTVIFTTFTILALDRQFFVCKERLNPISGKSVKLLIAVTDRQTQGCFPYFVNVA